MMLSSAATLESPPPRADGRVRSRNHCRRRCLPELGRSPGEVRRVRVCISRRRCYGSEAETSPPRLDGLVRFAEASRRPLNASIVTGLKDGASK
jgi:hypothetical protein